MKPTTKIYFRTFIVSALIFGALMTAYQFVAEGRVVWYQQLFQSTFFGLFMTLLSALSVKRVIKKHGIENPTIDDFKVNQIITIDSPLSSEQVLELINKNEDTKGWTLKFDTEKNLSGKTDVNWKSWGEKIALKFTDGKITIESRPVVPTTLFDGGKNLGNVMTLKGIIVNATS
ncbi:MAG: hypothetical protein GC178_12600 [Flavobacteriales bacterium]|nr:hypothetical protein [Flavobacteriales bacterium]